MNERRHGDDCATGLTLSRTDSVGQPPDASSERSDRHGEEHSAWQVYEIESEHARGGLGRVLKAYDPRLGRTIAIKELLQPQDSTYRRFVRETRITARLQHPGVVPLYEAGHRPDGRPYYTMKFVAGRTFRDFIRETTNLDQRLSLLPKIILAVETMAYAHAERIVHRDLKPANIMIGAFGETLIVDWGLAKDLSEASSEDEADLGPYRQLVPERTAAGTVLGTPSYMPPEQARGEAVTESADVYSLGAILYYLLSGISPYSGADSAAVLKQVLAAPPTPLLELQPGTPRDLLAVVAKAMARNPIDRYSNAGEMAEDLRRFQAGQMVRAHHYSLLSRLGRAIRQHRVPVALSTAFLILLGISATFGLKKIISERNRANTRTNEMMLLQARAWLERDPTTALAWLKRYPSPGTDTPGLRNLALEARNSGPAQYVFRRPGKDDPFGAFSHHGNRFVSTAQDGIYIWNLDNGAIVDSLPYADSPSMFVFSLEDTRVFFTDWDSSKLMSWDLKTHTYRQFQFTENEPTWIELSSDGKYLAVAARDRAVHL